MSSIKAKKLSVNRHKADRNHALKHLGELWRNPYASEMDAGWRDFKRALERDLDRARKAIRDHREMGKSGRLVARINRASRPFPPASARSRGQWLRLRNVAESKGMGAAALVCDGYAKGWDSAHFGLIPSHRVHASQPWPSPWPAWALTPTSSRTHSRHA